MTANKNRKFPKKALLSKDEIWLLRLIEHRPVGWAQVYCKAVDTLMNKEFIEWDHKDDRGMYYNSIRITEAGRIAFNERNTNGNSSKT